MIIVIFQQAMASIQINHQQQDKDHGVQVNQMNNSVRKIVFILLLVNTMMLAVSQDLVLLYVMIVCMHLYFLTSLIYNLPQFIILHIIGGDHIKYIIIEETPASILVQFTTHPTKSLPFILSEQTTIYTHYIITKTPRYFKSPDALEYSAAASYCQSKGTNISFHWG